MTDIVEKEWLWSAKPLKIRALEGFETGNNACSTTVASYMQDVLKGHYSLSLSLSLSVVVVECCFTTTETVGLLGTGAQDVYLDFHTAPELLSSENIIITT